MTSYTSEFIVEDEDSLPRARGSVPFYPEVENRRSFTRGFLTGLCAGMIAGAMVSFVTGVRRSSQLVSLARPEPMPFTPDLTERDSHFH